MQFIYLIFLYLKPLLGESEVQESCHKDIIESYGLISNLKPKKE